MTGIMAMFEMATSFNSQQIQFRPLQLQDAYSGSSAQTADRELLEFFLKDDILESLGDEQGEEPLTGDELCKNLICRFNQMAPDCKPGSYDKDLFEGSILQTRNYLQSGIDADNSLKACVLTSKLHRILIVPDFNKDADPYVPYSLYSCLTPQGQRCLFEN